MNIGKNNIYRSDMLELPHFFDTQEKGLVA